MKKITKTYEVYTYAELSKEVQEQVLENFHDINIDDVCYEYEFEEMIEMLAKKGFEDAKISFSGFCSQGDGASFIADIDIDKVLKYFKIKIEYAELLKYTDITGCIKTDHSNYSHSNTMITDLEYDETKKIPADKEQKMYDLQETLENTILEIARDEANKIYDRLGRSYDSLISEDAIINTLNECEHTFLKNGKQFNE